MPHHLHFEQRFWEFPVSLTLILPLLALLYVRGWISVRLVSATALPVWKVASFLLGLLLIWTAWGSPLAVYDHNLLTFHMIKHLLLMTFAPPLLLLGEPLEMFWHAMPRLARNILGRVSRQPAVQRVTRTVTTPVLCLTVSTLTLLLWHLPALFALCIRSEVWHTVEQTTFLGAGLLFWWPVIEPSPSASTGPRWSILLYLFLATLPCDILSGFLVFSDRVAYPVYLSAPRMFGFSALEDQQCAAALMWTCVTLVYLVPAAIISTRLLAPQTSEARDLTQPQSGQAVHQMDSQRLGVV
ncbi:MAG: cytochrome c oxidase assembly protein [Candidatus Acidiferrum sp.]